MPTPLDVENRRFIDEMLQASVLGNHIPERLNVSDGIILMCCSDGDQFDVVIDHMRDTALAAGAKPRIHTIANHGGALLASPDCPLFKTHDVPKLMVTQVHQARAMKGINSVALSVHAPCGAAGMAGLNVVELIDHLMRAKIAVKDSFKRQGIMDVKVLCVLFVDFGDGDKRSFTIARKDWDRWRGTRYGTGEFSAPPDTAFAGLQAE